MGCMAAAILATEFDCVYVNNLSKEPVVSFLCPEHDFLLRADDGYSHLPRASAIAAFTTQRVIICRLSSTNAAVVLVFSRH